MPFTEIKSMSARWYVICNIHDRRVIVYYYCQDCDVALSVVGCFKAYHRNKHKMHIYDLECVDNSYSKFNSSLTESMEIISKYI
jgi:hypothetical protein